MKEYHTAIIINSPATTVWEALTDFTAYPDWNPIVGKMEGEMKEGNRISTFIVPLNKTYYPIIMSYKVNKELVWLGAQGAKFLMAGKHYYRLEKISEIQTKLLHGEYFFGLFSYFIPASLLNKMKTAFEQHNIILKQRIENGER